MKTNFSQRVNKTKVSKNNYSVEGIVLKPVKSTGRFVNNLSTEKMLLDKLKVDFSTLSTYTTIITTKFIYKY